MLPRIALEKLCRKERERAPRTSPGWSGPSLCGITLFVIFSALAETVRRSVRHDGRRWQGAASCTAVLGSVRSDWRWKYGAVVNCAFRCCWRSSLALALALRAKIIASWAGLPHDLLLPCLPVASLALLWKVLFLHSAL